MCAAIDPDVEAAVAELEAGLIRLRETIRAAVARDGIEKTDGKA